MDWIKTGWGPGFSPVFNEHLHFYIDVSGASRSTRPLSEIAIDVVNNISKTYPAPYTLMMSGGVDSQAMLWCWLNADVPFTITTIRYLDNNGKVLNNHDISNMNLIADKFKVTVNYMDFNVIDFLENHLIYYATTYQCTSPQLTTYMKMSEMIETGTIIFGGDFLLSSACNYTILGLKRYADATNTAIRKVIPFFLLHDAELAVAVDVKKDVTYIPNIPSVEERTYMYKIAAMKSKGIPIIPQDTKYSGFEEIKNVYDKRIDLITPKDRIRYADKPSRRLFDIAFRYKLTEIIKYVDDIKWIS